jgi:hypothetical protein
MLNATHNHQIQPFLHGTNKLGVFLSADKCRIQGHFILEPFNVIGSVSVNALQRLVELVI